MMSVFFFFKQKKAYEMRISDWSADVCSSDLRTLCAQVAAELAERVAHVGHGAHLVVGQAVDDHRHAARRVALVADLLVLDALQLAGGFLQRALDGVLGHVDRQALVDRRAQARAVGRLGAALAGRDGDFADDLGEDLAALGVGGVLASFDGGAATHGKTLVLRGEPAILLEAGAEGPGAARRATRSEERRVGKEGGRTGRARWSAYQ